MSSDLAAAAAPKPCRQTSILENPSFSSLNALNLEQQHSEMANIEQHPQSNAALSKTSEGAESFQGWFWVQILAKDLNPESTLKREMSNVVPPANTLSRCTGGSSSFGQHDTMHTIPSKPTSWDNAGGCCKS